MFDPNQKTKSIQLTKSLNSTIRKGRSQSPTIMAQKQVQMSTKGIEELKKQNQNMREEINLEEKNSHNTEVKLMLKLNRLQEEGSHLAKRIEIENQRYNLLQRELITTKSQIQNKKTVYQGQGENNVNDTQQKLKILEHRQEKYMQKNNELFATILKTKDQLKAARRERVIFDNIFTNIESDLKKKEEEIKSLILVASQIDIYKRELDCLQQQIQNIYDMEQQFFTETCKSALKTPASEMELEENIKKPNMQESSFSSDENLSENKDHFESTDNKEEVYYNNMQSTQPIMEKIEEQENETFDQLIVPVKNTLKEIEVYEQQLEKLKSKTQNKTIQGFIESFRNYKQVNEDLFDQNEELQEKISSVQKEIEQINHHPLQNEDKVKMINQLDEKYTQLDDKSKMALKIEQIQENDNIITYENDQILKALQNASKMIPDILEKLECNSQEYLKENYHMHVHPNNILQYLQIIEQRVDEVVQLEQAIDKNNLYGKVYGQLPFNVKKLKDKEKRLNYINDVLDNLEKQKEGDKIMSIQELHAASDREVQRYISSNLNKSNINTFYQQTSTNQEGFNSTTLKNKTQQKFNLTNKSSVQQSQNQLQQ